MSDQENLEPELEGDANLEGGDVTESQPDVELESDVEIESDDHDANGSEGEAAWEANYSYRYNDEEYEMDDRLKALIDSPETEELVRDLVERAEGLNLLKEQRQHLRDEVSQLRHVESQRQQAVNQMSQFLQQGDLRSFTKAWGITPEQIRNLALEDARIAELPEDQQQAWYRSQQAQEQAWHLQQQNQQLQQQFNQMAVNQRENELQGVLHHERYASAAQVFDERAGRPGAFRDEIIRRGQYYAQVHQKDVPPHTLAEELLAYVGQPQVQQQHAPATQQKPVVTQPRKPTMPQVRGNSGSPVKSTVRSIADIKKLADQFATG